MKTRSIALILAAVLFSSAAMADAPTCPANMAKNECVYFKEGYAVGNEDAKASLSNAYQRHEDSYDSRFESAFSKGYEQGWKDAKAKK
jgi:hypothetical protein